MFRSILILVSAIVCMLDHASSYANGGAVKKTKHIEIQGHRGARSVLPENTLVAFEYAMEIGVDTLEFDLGVTSDEVVVVYHDQKINPTICQYLDGSPIEGDRWLHQMTLEEVKKVDCGAKPNPRFPFQTLKPKSQIPTLDEVFKMVADSSLENAGTILFNIETKSNPNHPQAQPEPERFVELILEQVVKHGVDDRVTIQSFDHRTLIAAKQLAPDVQLSALFGEAPTDWIIAAKAAKADIVSPHYKTLDQASVKAIQSAGLRVIPWTANTEASWQQLVSIGVDGIISDDPARLMEFLDSL